MREAYVSQPMYAYRGSPLYCRCRGRVQEDDLVMNKVQVLVRRDTALVRRAA